MRSPWTHDELALMRANLEASIEATEADEPDARGLPPMTLEEAKGLMLALVDTAKRRRLTPAEVFLHGQLLAQFRQATQAECLGKRGRYYVVSEADIERLSRVKG